MKYEYPLYCMMPSIDMVYKFTDLQVAVRIKPKPLHERIYSNIPPYTNSNYWRILNNLELKVLGILEI